MRRWQKKCEYDEVTKRRNKIQKKKKSETKEKEREIVYGSVWMNVYVCVRVSTFSPEAVCEEDEKYYTVIVFINFFKKIVLIFYWLINLNDKRKQDEHHSTKREKNKILSTWILPVPPHTIVFKN